MNRRYFLGSAIAGGLALGTNLRVTGGEPTAADHLVVGVMGTGGRGTSLASAFAKLPGVSVKTVCDADSKRAAGAASAVEKAAGKAAEPVQDFRRILDDKDINILVVATCNHWHAPAAILGCAAGKHVYVEKPCSHNPREGELLVAASRKHRKQVQMGNQRRSWPKVIEAIQQVRDGAIGRVFHAQSWYTAQRPSIGKGQPKPVPEGLDYDLWQGPAPRREFRSNFLHYHWHWFWHWGNGELGNNGVHMLDLCRWGLGVDYPVRVTSTGGRYRFDDDQETPDTHTVTFDFDGHRAATWDGMSCETKPSRKMPDLVFHGDKGRLAIDGNAYTIYDVDGKQVKKESGSASDAMHLTNFLDAIRKGGSLNSEILDGHKSTLLCHLGNISHRVGRALKCDAKDGKILDDAEAMKLWSREYEKGWEPKV